MAKTTRLSATERWWIKWVITNLHANGVMFIDGTADQRIIVNKDSLFILDPRKNLTEIPEKGIVIRANPARKKRKK